MRALAGWFIGLLLFSTLSSARYTYWVDSSCRLGPRQEKFDAAVKGALDLATRAFQRLRDPGDTNNDANFNKLFKASPIDPPTPGIVNTVLGSDSNGMGIARLQELPNDQREQSNIRIYCDNDVQDPDGRSRWTLRRDVPLSQQYPGYIPNALRSREPVTQPGTAPPPGQYQEWEDRANGVPTLEQGCRAPYQNGIIFGNTFLFENLGLYQDGQELIRSTITLCNVLMDDMRGPNSIDDLLPRKDLSRVSIGMEAFQAIAAFTVFHEFCHAQPHTKDDVEILTGTPRKAYAWTDSLDLSAKDSLENVNNYVFLGVLAKLADRKFRLSRQSHADWHDRGLLVYDPDLSNQNPQPVKAADRTSLGCPNTTGTDWNVNCTGPRPWTTARPTGEKCANLTDFAMKGRICSELSA